jgi:glycosyltransferase involved in cell wall biosynthesis
MELNLDNTQNIIITEPLVSVLMTAYNRQAYIGEAIESVLNSDYKNFELIITDDRSTDDTFKIAKSYALEDKRIRLFLNEKNLGQFENRNMAAAYAKGKYIKYLDSDDKFYDFSLAYCVNMMENNPTAEWGLLSLSKEDESLLLTPSESMKRNFFGKPFLSIGPDGSIYKNDFFKKINGFSTKYGPANDVYTNLVAASMGNVVLLTRDFFFYRLHDGQAMNNKYAYLYNNYCLTKDAFPFLERFFTKAEIQFIENKNKRRFTVNMVKYFFRTFNFSKTNFAIKQAQFSLKDALQGIFH